MSLAGFFGTFLGQIVTGSVLILAFGIVLFLLLRKDAKESYETQREKLEEISTYCIFHPPDRQEFVIEGVLSKGSVGGVIADAQKLVNQVKKQADRIQRGGNKRQRGVYPEG